MEDNETVEQTAKTNRTLGGFLTSIGRKVGKATTVVSGSKRLRALTAGAISAGALALGFHVDGEHALLVVSAVMAFAGWGSAPADEV